MTHVFESVSLICPYARARECLSEALALPPRDVTTLDKNVLVRYERGSDPTQFDEPWRVFWTVEGGGPYPDFSGIINVRADAGFRGAVLELHGDYTPPMGTVGKAFDLVLGSKIAVATARALLKRIAAQIEACSS